MILDAADKAGIAPLGILKLHSFAYLANVLAPVWDIRPLDGKIFKRREGPFYPALQMDLDRLVGRGLVLVSSITYVRSGNGWRLDAAYRLNRDLAGASLAFVRGVGEPFGDWDFIDELAYALSALSDHDLESIVSEDAAYSDEMVSYGDVVDFGEWRHLNYSANAARLFEGLVPGATTATRGEMIHLYVRHLFRKLHDTG